MNYDIEKIVSIYLEWKNINKNIKDYWTQLNSARQLKYRLLNLPEVVSEGLICNIFDLLWSREKNSDSADAKTIDHKKVQIKASMNYENDLTSFGPKSKFDILVYCGIKDDKFFIHIFDELDWLYNLKVSKRETFKQQQVSLRRPRFSIYNQWIKINDIKPNVIISLLTMEDFYCIRCYESFKNCDKRKLPLSQNFYFNCKKCV